jgi:hypothetical protein
MRRQGLALILFLLLAISPAMAVAGTCGTRADRLEDFARCMVPLRGTIGTATVYTSGQYDHDHQQLMSAMASQMVVPQQVMPTMPMPYYGMPVAYGFSPFGAMGSMWGAAFLYGLSAYDNYNPSSYATAYAVSASAYNALYWIGYYASTR